MKRYSVCLSVRPLVCPAAAACGGFAAGGPAAWRRYRSIAVAAGRRAVAGSVTLSAYVGSCHGHRVVGIAERSVQAQLAAEVLRTDCRTRQRVLSDTAYGRTQQTTQIAV